MKETEHYKEECLKNIPESDHKYKQICIFNKKEEIMQVASYGLKRTSHLPLMKGREVKLSSSAYCFFFLPFPFSSAVLYSFIYFTYSTSFLKFSPFSRMRLFISTWHTQNFNQLLSKVQYL